MAGSILMIVRSFSEYLVQKKNESKVVFILKRESAVTMIFWIAVLIAVLAFKITN